MEQKAYTPEQLNKLRKAILDPKARFAFMPHASLKESIVRGTDETLKDMPQSMKEVLLSMPNDAAIAVDNRMVMRFLEGKLDEKNAYLFKMGEIIIVNDSMTIM